MRYFCKRIIPNLRSSTDALRNFSENKPTGKDGWAYDRGRGVSCSFTRELEMLEGFESEENKWEKKGDIMKTWEEIKN